MRILISVLLLFSTWIAVSSCGNSEQAAITIDGAWIREAPPNATAMAGYMQINNHSDQDITLVTANSEAFKVIEFHRSVEKDGMYRMIRHEKLVIPAMGTLELKPGDYHLMLITPQRSLQDGDTVKVQLAFSDQSEVILEIPIKKVVFE